MSKITQVEVSYGDVKEAINIKRLRYRQQMRLFATMNEGSVKRRDEEGAEIVERKPESIGNYQIELIAACVCDENGKTIYTPDEVDAWAEEDSGSAKIIAYIKTITAAVAPSAGQVEGNS